MTNEISIVDNKRVGILKVKYEGDTFAIFNYCTEGEEGHFTKKQAKKLTEKLVRKIENSTTIKTKKGFKLLKPKGNDNDQR